MPDVSPLKAARRDLLHLVLYFAGPGLTAAQRAEIEDAIDIFERVIRNDTQ